MIIAEDVVLPGFIVTMLDADFREVKFGGLLGIDQVETTELGVPVETGLGGTIIKLKRGVDVSTYNLKAIGFVKFQLCYGKITNSKK